MEKTGLRKEGYPEEKGEVLGQKEGNGVDISFADNVYYSWYRSKIPPVFLSEKG